MPASKGLPSAPARPKIMFFGDPHGDFRHVIRSIEKHRPEAAILLGDLEPKRSLHLELWPALVVTNLWFIHGNHDTDSEAIHDNVFCDLLSHRNLHFKVIQIGGMLVSGLGGVFRKSIWAPPLPPAYQSAEEKIKSL